MKRLTSMILGYTALMGMALAPADAATGAAPAKDKPAPAAADATSGPRRFTEDQIKEMRKLRAEVHPADHDKAGRPVWSHAKLAEKFNTTAGVVSQIVRNRTYKDTEYKPVNDGK